MCVLTLIRKGNLEMLLTSIFISLTVVKTKLVCSGEEITASFTPLILLRPILCQLSAGRARRAGEPGSRGLARGWRGRVCPAGRTGTARGRRG